MALPELTAAAQRVSGLEDKALRAETMLATARSGYRLGATIWFTPGQKGAYDRIKFPVGRLRVQARGHAIWAVGRVYRLAIYTSF